MTAAQRFHLRHWRKTKPPRHGVNGGSTNYGCHCPACREAHRVYTQQWRLRRKQRQLLKQAS